MHEMILTSINVEDLLDMFTARIKDVLTVKTQAKKDESVPEDLLSIEDIMKIFNVSKVTVHKWKQKGLLPFYKMNRKVYFKKSEVISSMSHKKRKMEV
jgi:hypothetical protein